MNNLNLNECIYTHPFEGIDYKNNYPSNTDATHNALKLKIANHINTNQNNITITSGGDVSIILCVDTLFRSCPHKINIYKYEPSYNKLCEKYDVIKVETPLNNKYLSMELYDPPDGSIIYIVNPCNPTGELWDEKDIETLCEKYPKCNIIVDEAYMEFVDIYKSCNNVNKYKNIFYIRTFSKLFGLAGMRIGYLVHPQSFLTNYPFKNVLTVSKKYALNVFENLPFYEKIQHAVNANKIYIGARNHGNFIYIITQCDQVKDIKKELEEKCIIARYDYGNSIRITINPHDKDLTFFRYIYKKYNNTPDIRTFYTPIESRIHLLKLFKILMKEISIQWWMDGGSLLGAERHNAIIPWDDDIDISFLQLDNYAEFESRLNKFFNLKKNITGIYYQICDIGYDGHPRDTIHIDLFPYIVINNQYVHKDERFRVDAANLVNMSYDMDELFPLRKLRFYDFDVPVPKKTILDKYADLKIFDGDELIYHSDKMTYS